MSVPSPPQVPQQARLFVTAEESSALGKVMWFGILELVGIGVGWAISFYLFNSIFLTLSSIPRNPNPTPADVSAVLGPLFQAFSIIVPVTVIVQLAALGILTQGFRQLGKIDRPRFSIPTIFMIIMLLGLILVVIGVIPLLESIPRILAAAPTTPGGAPSPAFTQAIGTVFLFFAFVGLGGILSFIGLIGGEILGLWRVGSRYDLTIIKLGAIFQIIPLLNIVAPILIVLGAHEVRGWMANPH